MISLLRAAGAASVIFIGVCAASCGQPPPAPAVSAEAQEDADYGLRLALIEGHLQIGRALVEAGQKDNAIPHFGHPVREIYGDLRPVIEARGGEQFQGELVRLESLAVLNGASPEFGAAFDAAMAKVAAARALIPAERLNSDAYVLRLVSDITTTSAQEYRNALVGGRIDSLIEYHDARGFMFFANDVLAAHRGADPRLAQAAALVGEVKAFVEPLDPPNPPLATDAQFEQKAAALRTLTGASAPTVTDAHQ